MIRSCGSTNNEVLRLLVLLASQEQTMANGRTFLECKKHTGATVAVATVSRVTIFQFYFQ
jgi:hypothetical protein